MELGPRGEGKRTVKVAHTDVAGLDPNIPAALPALVANVGEGNQMAVRVSGWTRTTFKTPSNPDILGLHESEELI